MFLVDTNVFLEVLLSQVKKEICKSFLNKNMRNINITDFSLKRFFEIVDQIVFNLKKLDF